METYCVYRHVNKINGKQYIGITKRKPEERWGSDGSKYKSTPHFYNAILKYGWDNFEHEILHSNLSKEQACRIEIELIQKYNTQNRELGYNIMEGGTAPTIPMDVREKMSKAMMGNKNGLGKVCSEEKKEKIRQANTGKKHSEEWRKNISKAKKGKTHKPISAEARKKIADAHEKKEVYCPETNTVYESIQECARQLDVPATMVCRICKGKGKTSHGYHFQYANKE